MGGYEVYSMSSIMYAYEWANMELDKAKGQQVKAEIAMVAYCASLFKRLSPTVQSELQETNFDDTLMTNRLALHTLVSSERDAVTVLRMMKQYTGEILQ